MNQTVTATDVFLFDEESSIVASYEHFNYLSICRGTEYLKNAVSLNNSSQNSK